MSSETYQIQPAVSFNASRIEKSGLYGVPQPVEDVRNHYYRVFSSQIQCLLDQKKPKPKNSIKGLLNPRRVFRYKFNNDIFRVKESKPTHNTTYIFLLDASSSMTEMDKYTPGSANGKYIQYIQHATAIVSAFALASRKVLGKDSLPIEVLSKTFNSVDFVGMDLPLNGTPFLTRVFSSSVPLTNSHTRKLFDGLKNPEDALLSVCCNCPIVGSSGGSQGSWTPEPLVFPAVADFIKNKVTTKNVTIVNLSDGLPMFTLTDTTNGAGYGMLSGMIHRMYNMNLRGVPMVNLLFGGIHEKDAQMYPGHTHFATGSLAPKLMGILKTILNAEV